MFFTLDDLKKIQEYLVKNSVKDSELDNASPIDGTEIMSLVQDGKNVKITLSDLVQLINQGIPDFVNVTDKYDIHSLSETISNIPFYLRKSGQTVTFNQDGIWKTYQFQGDVFQWADSSKWIEK